MTYNAVGYCFKILITSSGLILVLLLSVSLFDITGLPFYDVLSNSVYAFFVICLLELPLMVVLGVLIEFLGFRSYTPLFFKRLITYIILFLCSLSFILTLITNELYIVLLPFVVYMITTLLGVWMYKLEPAYKNIIEPKESMN
jgi:hypothetical protein